MRIAAIACTPPLRSVRTRASMPAARACRRAPTISSPPTRPHPASWRFHRGMFRMNLREPPQRCACADADDGSFAIGCARQPSRAHVRLPRQLKRTSCASLLAVRAALFEGARLRIARLLGCAPRGPRDADMFACETTTARDRLAQRYPVVAIRRPLQGPTPARVQGTSAATQATRYDTTGFACATAPADGGTLPAAAGAWHE